MDTDLTTATRLDANTDRLSIIIPAPDEAIFSSASVTLLSLITLKKSKIQRDTFHIGEAGHT
jgi:hypothetical protein